MADMIPRKKLTPSTIVAIIAVSSATILGGVTIWQTSAYTEKARLEQRIDKLTDSVNAMNITIATIGQRLEDHIRSSK